MRRSQTCKNLGAGTSVNGLRLEWICHAEEQTAVAAGGEGGEYGGPSNEVTARSLDLYL